MKKIIQKTISSETKRVCTLVMDYDLNPISLPVEQDRLYVTVQDEEAALMHYQKLDNIVIAPKASRHLYESSRRFGLVLADNAKNRAELIWALKQLTSFHGMALVRYDHLTNPANASTWIKALIETTAPFGLQPVLHLQEDGKRYITFTRKDINLVRGFEEKYEHHAHVFTCPILDIDCLKSGSINNKPFSGAEPASWVEDVPTEWRWKYFSSKITLRRQVLEKIRREKMLGSSVMPLNQEQMAVALASGRIKDEVVLSDGRVFIFKGTERVETDEVLKRSIDGAPEAVRAIDKKRGVVIGLEMTRGEYVRFE